MDSRQLIEYIDQQRWLLNNGLINDAAKNQLFLYGSIVHKEVKAVELDIEPSVFSIRYKIYVDNSLIKKIEKYNKYSKSTSLWGMWQFKRMLKNGDNLNFHHILNKFVKDFCGPKWTAEVDVINFDSYSESKEVKGGNIPSTQHDKPSNPE